MCVSVEPVIDCPVYRTSTLGVHLRDVTLEHGVTYYTTVEACNGAGLCVTVTSDGIIVDTSPPVAGVLFDGIGRDDVEYQSSR